MGWGTYTLLPVYYSRETFKTKFQVKERLSENRERLAEIRERILMYISTTDFHKIVPKDEEMSPLEYIHSEFKELWDEACILASEISELRIMVENWEEAHTTLEREDGTKETAGIVPFKGDWFRMFMAGDFIPEVGLDGKEITYGDEDND